MKCDACSNAEASVFLTKIIDGKMQKVNLCPACAKAKGVADPASFQWGEILSGIGSSHDLERTQKNIKCEVCGFTQTELKKTARLGCSNCYKVFSDALSGMIKSMHKGTSHIGKCPRHFRSEQEKNNPLSNLDKELLSNLEGALKTAVENENYEDAAKIRDAIRTLTSKANPQENQPAPTSSSPRSLL